MTDTTKREAVLAAQDLALKTALEALPLSLKYMQRNSGLVEKLEGDDEVTVSGPALVMASLKDGDALEPEPLLGSDIWDHVQGPVLEIVVLHPDAPVRDAAMDVVLLAVATVHKNDPTLGGACDYAQPQAPAFSVIGDPDAPRGRAAEVGIEILFQSDSPIG